MHAFSKLSREWLRPHLSAIVFGSLVCAFGAFINVPGTREGAVRAHGWPLTYMYRAEEVPPNPPGVICSLRAIRVPDIWSITEDVSQFRALLLCINMVAVFALGLVAVTAFEAWRRWYGPIARFSLRTALVCVTMCALFFAWIHHRVSRCESQRTVIAQIERAGGTVRHESILPDWLRELFSDDLGRPFDDVLMVDLSYSKASDDDLKNLAVLREVRSLNLDSTQITDAGLLHIANLRKLTWLSLDDTATSDRGLEHLQHLSNLETLGLEKTRVAGPGFEHLQHLKKLEILAIRDTPLTDEGLRHLTLLPSLWCIYTDGTRITAKGAADFERQSQRHVNIEHFGSGSAGMKDPARALLEPSDMQEFVGVPLDDAIAYLTDLHNVNFKWDESAIEGAKTGGRSIADVKQLPVTIDRSGTLHDVLTDLLQQKGLTFKLVDDGVLITTPEQ